MPDTHSGSLAPISQTVDIFGPLAEISSYPMATPQVQRNLPICITPTTAVQRGWELAAPSIDYQHLTSGRNGAGASFVGVEPKNEAFLGGNPANDEAIPQSIPLNFAKVGYTTILTTPKITTILAKY